MIDFADLDLPVHAPPSVTLGEYAASAYRAYAASTGNRNFRGEPMPEFPDLPEPIRRAWLVAVLHTLVVSKLPNPGDLIAKEQAWAGWVPPPNVSY